jgi:hypothetical protein
MPFVFRTEADFCIHFPVTSCCHKRIPLPYTSCLAHLSIFCPSRSPFLSFCIYSTRPHLRCVTFPHAVLPDSTCIPLFNEFFTHSLLSFHQALGLIVILSPSVTLLSFMWPPLYRYLNYFCPRVCKLLKQNERPSDLFVAYTFGHKLFLVSTA